MENKGRAAGLVLIIAMLLLAGCRDGAVKTEVQGAQGASIHTGEKLTVYTSFYPIYDLAAKIGGDKARIVNMVPAGMEPHDWEPSAADRAGLEHADILLYNGLGLEHWIDKIKDGLRDKDIVIIEASEGIETLTEAGHDQAHADKENYGGDGSVTDPHVWLSPLNAKKEMGNIKNGFILADPENEAYYEANYERYSVEFDALDKEFREALSSLPCRDIVVAHEAFGYLCNAYGLHQVAIEGLSPDAEPSPARMAEMIDFARANHIKVIFFEEMVSPDIAETIARAVGAETGVLNPLEGLSQEDMDAGADYFSIMRENLAALRYALE